MSDPVRYAIIGVGGFGKQRRARLRAAGCFRIVGGLDVRPEAYDEADREEGATLRRYASIEELVGDPEVEAVFIATPAAVHVAQAMTAARSGKAIFVEKPLGHDLEACRDLVAYCEANRIPHGHGFGLRFAPLWVHVKQLLAAQTLGRIVSVSATSMHTGGLAFNPDNWRFRPDQNPGGPLFQCGIHKIDLLRYLLGEGRWTAGIVQRDISPSPTDDAYVLMGVFGGIPCTLHSHYVASYRHALEIYGTTGDLFITEYPTRIEHKTTDIATGAEGSKDITGTIGASDAERDSLIDFGQAVRERRQPLMNGREGLSAIELIFDAVRISQLNQECVFCSDSKG